MPNLDQDKVHHKLAHTSCLALSAYQPMTPAEIRQKGQRITRRSDLPQARGLAAYIWNDPDVGEVRTIVSKRDRQVLDAIIKSPVFCASPIRVSDSVLRLRRDHGVPVLREDYTEQDGDETLNFGIYHLGANVQLAPSKVEGK